MSTTTAADLDVRPLSVEIGAEIRGADVGRPLPDAVVAQIRQVLLDRHVVFLPDQELTADAYIAFASRLGRPTRPHPVHPGVEGGHSVIFDPYGRGRHGPPDQGELRWGNWHSDLTFLARPPAIALLHLELAPPLGGDTIWASTEAAFRRLSPPVQALARTLVAVHDGNHVFGADLERFGSGEWEGERFEGRFPLTEHPVVTVHPETGREALFVNPNFVRRLKGVAAHESRHLLDLFYEHITRPEHSVRYRWSEGTLAIWDNRATAHYAVGDYGDAPRRVRRITLSGERPAGPAPAP